MFICNGGLDIWCVIWDGLMCSWDNVINFGVLVNFFIVVDYCLMLLFGGWLLFVSLWQNVEDCVGCKVMLVLLLGSLLVGDLFLICEYFV